MAWHGPCWEGSWMVLPGTSSGSLMSKEPLQIANCPFKASLGGWLFVSLDRCCRAESSAAVFYYLWDARLVPCLCSNLTPSPNVGKGTYGSRISGCLIKTQPVWIAFPSLLLFRQDFWHQDHLWKEGEYELIWEAVVLSELPSYWCSFRGSSSVCARLTGRHGWENRRCLWLKH